jgi:tripartite-type tricarboxylate transporter receptor subunit TctC
MATRLGRSIIAVASACFLGVISCETLVTAETSDYPTRQIQVVVPFPAGGSADYFARSMFNRLSPIVRQPIVIENKAGAGGIIGAKAVIGAPPDGYTLLVSAVVSVLVAPHLSSPPAFDALTELTPITGIGTVPAVLVVRPSLVD